MKKIIFVFIVIALLTSCSNNQECCEDLKPVTVNLKFTHNWDEVPVTASDFNNFKFTNANGELISIAKLRYLVSNITLGNQTKDYQLVNLGEATGLEIQIKDVPQGSNNLKFTFGFTDKDNQDGVYQDLNSVSFGVPMMLGGGYHFMQFDGKYKDENNQSASFNYHVIRAAVQIELKQIILGKTCQTLHF